VRQIHGIRCGPLTATADLPLGAEAELTPYEVGADLQGAR
jgi:hypothetical protein